MRKRAPAIVLLVFIAILALALARFRGPAPVPASAPASEFSAERALAFHREVIGNAPHATGSREHDLVRDRLAARFRTLGYDTAIEQRFACNPYASCAPVANVIARRPGDAAGDVVLLVAHYDSVGAGPGASDDGNGGAAFLEIARAIRNERTRNPIVFLVTDAEEQGLIGAEGFVADASAARGVAVVVNVEARGTSGPSFLFETSRHNQWLLPIVARALPRPATSSLFFNIYELLPNDTDLTVFKRAGYQGLNFANIGEVAHYHTPLDDPAHITPRTLQHHGEHLLAMARALAATELRRTTDDNAVWFDVLSFFIVWWPQRWSMMLSILMLVLVIAAAVVRLRDGATTARAVTMGVAAFFLALFMAFLLGFVATWITGFRALGATWVAQPGPSIAAMWLIGIGSAFAAAKWLHGYAGFDGLFLGTAVCWCVLSISLATVLPGAVYLTLVPATALAVCAIVRAAREADEGGLAIVCGAIAAIVHFPLAFALYDALGQPSLPVTAAALALVTTTFAPLLAAAEQRRALAPAIWFAAAACVVMALALPPYTADAPRHISLRYVDDGGAPRWETDALTPPLHRAAAFDIKPRAVGAEWLRTPGRTFAAPAPAMNLPPAEAVLLSRNGHQVSILVRSPRGAPRVSLAFRAESLRSMTINGVTPPPPTARHVSFLAPGWHRVAVRGASEARIDLVLDNLTESIETIVSDASFGLPAAGAALVRARGESAAVPIGEGDLTITSRRQRL
jgi:Peptidase family M28